MRDTLKIYKQWLSKAGDETLHAELVGIDGNHEEIDNRFYKDLEFGTGGLRGILGAGTNYLNIYTIRKATKGLADYINSIGGKSVVICCDSRNNSRLFSENAAMVFAANGIKAYLCRELMPTPFASFAVRKLRADAGVMVTASHNPAQYNGYKVYGADGCQITDEFAEKVMQNIVHVDGFGVGVQDLQQALECGSVEYIGEDVIDDYIKNVTAQSINDCGGISVTYTPLNGSGYKIIPRVLKMRGVEKLFGVDEQSFPDGNFPTCTYPNPEKEQALALGMEYAKRQGSDVLIATDPDADRVGIAIRQDGRYELMSGNEVGVLLTDYLMGNMLKNGTLPANPVIIKTIVTTYLADRVAADYGAQVINVLTGFKYIGEQIGLLEKAGRADSFVFAFEESYGYLAGSYVRDKDAVVACMLICEMVAYYKKQGKTLIDRMQELYQKYGKYAHKLVTREYPGASGSKKMQDLLTKLRNCAISDIGGLKVLQKTDYKLEETGLPKSDVIAYDLQDGARFVLRPSGTEPLIKFYLTAASDEGRNREIFEKLESFIEDNFS